MTAVSPEIFAQPRTRTGMATIAPALALAAISSIGAGAIHAAAIGVHSEHRQAVITFTIVAIAQLGWGVFALQRTGRITLLAGAAINVAAIVGWVMAKTNANGISFIDGLDEKESLQFADTTAAALAGVAVLAALVAYFLRNPQSWFGSFAFTGTALATAVLAAFAMVSAGSHAHAGGDGHTDPAGAVAHGHEDDTTDTGDAKADDPAQTAVVPPKEYDPTKPIDLGGVPGVTPEQQARAENLIAVTLLRLPKYADYRVAERDGFVSIGDAVTGDEHFVKQAYFDDGRILDPDYPESLVYKPNPDGTKTLAAAMYMMPPDTKWADIPDVGGPLTQWHIHDNLCFTPDSKVAGLTNPDGSCDPPLVKVVNSPMIHVWIQKHPCGPFAALEGIGGGTIKEGETRLCDHAHGAKGA
jgi:hypothetical protein